MLALEQLAPKGSLPAQKKDVAVPQSGKNHFLLGLWASGHTAGQAHWLAGQPLIHLKMVNFVMLNQKPMRQVHLQRHACRK